MKRFLVILFGSFFYTGFFPFAPATFASLVWLLLYLLLPGGRWISHPLAAAMFIPVAVYLSGAMEKLYGEDASQIVVDEFAGMQVVFVALSPSIPTAIAGFVLFRFFDVVKPFPVGASQKLRGGWGVVTDDLLAGAYARISLYMLMRFLELG